MGSFIEIRGKEFVCDGKPVLFKGLGISSWLNIEHFMVGMPCTDSQMRDSFRAVFGAETAQKFFEKFVLEFVTEEDFAYLKDMGINLLRVPFNYRLFLEDENPDAFREEGFRYLDRLLAFGRKYQIYILPDLHAVPGGQNPDWHSDNSTGHTQFWHYGVFRRQMAELWGRIAERYCEEPYLLGYDLLNEPCVFSDRSTDTGTSLIQDFYEETTREIRRYDGNHILFLEGDHFAMEFDCIREVKDAKTALMFHYYPTVWEPALYQKDYDPAKRREVFEDVFTSLLNIRERFDRPVLCGEAGYETDWKNPEFTVTLLQETVRLCRKYQVSFTLWSYKDARFMGLVYPKEESLWMKLAGEFGKTWDHDEDAARGEKAVNEFCGMYFPDASKEERYILSFRQRAILYFLQKKHLLEKVLRKHNAEEMLRLPESFRFENCERFEGYEMLLRKFHFQQGGSYDRQF
ncbi:glycoside hydrolase family 5 protein [Lachnoclostridium sp. Marseille-P6806]|uniref:glycoside hydrolase family 5 protein n=1 Tax=Lachnoclostridium sp. Marseille-P6806 TaxID=2364793 RepID=UPI0010319B05|nr:cellulase family glycosylhydrolase [Lachnoclostridium sp. Marseille-P6806]